MGKQTFFSTVRCISRLKLWKIIVTFRPGQPQLFFAKGRHILPVHDHGAGGGTLQQVHAPHQGALAGAGETDNSEDLPLLDVQADVLQGMDGVFTRSKGLVQVLNLNDRHGTTLLSGEFWQ